MKPSIVLRLWLPPSNVKAHDDEQFDQPVKGFSVRPPPRIPSLTDLILSSRAIADSSWILLNFGSSYDTHDHHGAAVDQYVSTTCLNRLNPYYLPPFLPRYSLFLGPAGRSSLPSLLQPPSPSPSTRISWDVLGVGVCFRCDQVRWGQRGADSIM